MRDAVTEINIDNLIARAAFIRWWRSMEAQGYQYGFEALCNVWVGFDDGRADLAKKVLEVVDLPALRELLIREGAYVDPAAPASPSPAELHNRLRWLLHQIISDLPANRDWLDPELEREARELTGVKSAAALRASVGEEGK